MISAKFTPEPGKRGVMSARIIGHANDDVCLATSNAFFGLYAQIEQLAKVYPEQIRIVKGRKS
jgi:uncharacterized protein YsxB (DUF464 family)